MKCSMCNYEINEELTYTVHMPETESVITVCGKCYVLVSILDTLKEVKDGNRSDR